jgi:predicted nucleic acid-binding protein
MTIHLDTSFLIRALVRGSVEDRLLRRWLGERRHLAMSAIAWTEFLCGPLEAEDVDLAAQVVGTVVAYGSSEGTVAAELFNAAGRRRGSLIDCMVAASALCHDAALATSNPADFRRFADDGLRVLPD